MCCSEISPAAPKCNCNQEPLPNNIGLSDCAGLYQVLSNLTLNVI